MVSFSRIPNINVFGTQGGVVEFMVSELVTRIIDDSSLPDGPIPTRWKKYLSQKINIFYWHCRLNRLPTCINLGDKGVDIPSLISVICNSDLEDVINIFYRVK